MLPSDLFRPVVISTLLDLQDDPDADILALCKGDDALIEAIACWWKILPLLEQCQLSPGLGVAEVCRNDKELIPFLVAAKEEMGEVAFPKQPITSHPRFVGHNIVRDKLGEGGMGVVYRAFSYKTNELVAIKIRSPTASTDRFDLEIRTTADLSDSPHIVKLFEANEWNGTCYYTMEYVPGGSLDRRLEKDLPTARAAAILVRDIAQGVEYIHSRNYVHRDLKPHNILIDSHGRPKIADFGIAKKVNANEQMTTANHIIASRKYAAPEQLHPDLIPISDFSLIDIFGIGTILFAALTGHDPVWLTPVSVTRGNIDYGELQNPQQINPGVPRDLATICLKCLQGNPQQRYQSAGQLYEDLNRFLVGEPIVARPDHYLRRFWRWCRRHTVVALTIGFVILIGCSLIVGLSLHDFILHKTNQKLEEALGDLSERTYIQDFHSASNATDAQRYSSAAAILANYSSPKQGVRDPRGPEWFALLNQLAAPKPLMSLAHDARVWSIDVCKSKGLIATSDATGKVSLWEFDSGNRLCTWEAHRGEANVVRFSPDGNTLLTGGQDRYLRAWPLHEIRSSFEESWEPAVEALGHSKAIYGLSISPDSQFIATGSRDGTIAIWPLREFVEVPRAGSGAPRPSPTPIIPVIRDSRNVYSLAFSTSSRLIAGTECGAIARSTSDGAEIFQSLQGKPGFKLYSVAPFGEERWIATTGYASDRRDGRSHPELRLDLDTDLWKRSLWILNSEGRLHDGFLTQTTQLCNDAVEPLVASGGREGVVYLWQLNGNQLEHATETQFAAHSNSIDTIRLSPDGERLLTGSSDGTVKVWSTRKINRPSLERILLGTYPLISAALSNSGSRVTAINSQGICTEFNRSAHTFHSTQITSDPIDNSNGLAACVCTKHRMIIFGIKGSNSVHGCNSINGSRVWDLPIRDFELIAITATGGLFAAVGTTKAAATQFLVGDCETGKVVQVFSAQYPKTPACVGLSRDGELLACGQNTMGFAILHSANGRDYQKDLEDKNSVDRIAFSGDGNTLALGCSSGQVVVVEAASRNVLWSDRVSTRPITGVSFSPDDRLLAVAEAGGNITVIHNRTKQVLFTFSVMPFTVADVSFSEDGSEVLCSVIGDEFLGRSGVIIKRIYETLSSNK